MPRRRRRVSGPPRRTEHATTAPSTAMSRRTSSGRGMTLPMHLPYMKCPSPQPKICIPKLPSLQFRGISHWAPTQPLHKRTPHLSSALMPGIAAIPEILPPAIEQIPRCRHQWHLLRPRRPPRRRVRCGLPRPPISSWPPNLLHGRNRKRGVVFGDPTSVFQPARPGTHAFLVGSPSPATSTGDCAHLSPAPSLKDLSAQHYGVAA